MTKVIIAGSRKFDDYQLLKDKCDQILYGIENIEIISGGSVGADFLGELYAQEKNYKFRRFLPEWNKYGKSAGPIRNNQMAKSADMLIAFWDGKSKGTRDMIKKAKQYQLIIHNTNPYDLNENGRLKQ